MFRPDGHVRTLARELGFPGLRFRHLEGSVLWTQTSFSFPLFVALLDASPGDPLE